MSKNHNIDEREEGIELKRREHIKDLIDEHLWGMDYNVKFLKDNRVVIYTPHTCDEILESYESFCSEYIEDVELLNLKKYDVFYCHVIKGLETCYEGLETYVGDWF